MKKLRQSKGLYFYTPKQYEDEVEFLITFTALSHGQLISLDNLIEAHKPNEYNYRVCKLTIKSIEDNLGNDLEFSALSPKVIAEVATEIIKLSGVTPDELHTLQKSVNIKFGSSFQAETWNCDVCKSKRLDKTRNCGFLGNKTADPEFKIHADNQVYTYCPIYDVDTDLLADAVDSYTMYDKKLLPDGGGLYDQTRFFVLASTIITQKLREEEAKAHKEAERKSKRK